MSSDAGTVRLTVAQALVRFLAAQRVRHADGSVEPFVAGCFGIFGHGNLAGVGQALSQLDGTPHGLRYVAARNEQAMVHAAAAWARHRRRRSIWACTTSVGPGATNLVTGAATATINRIPVLLLPGDTFATRRVDPVLQQLEHPGAGDITVNDCLRPVSRWFDRVVRPEQLVATLPEAMRVLLDPAETGAVTICLPQDVQAEAFDWPISWLEPRVHEVAAAGPAAQVRFDELRGELAGSRRPLIVVGGGVRYAGAEAQLRDLADLTGIPVVATQAGMGSLAVDHPSCLGAAGATGTSAANAALREADLLIGIGTRWDDFTTASRTAWSSSARLININVNARDAAKLGALPIVADARAGIALLVQALTIGVAPDGAGDAWPEVDGSWRDRCGELRSTWSSERARVIAEAPVTPGMITQASVIGVANEHAADAEASGRGATVVCAAGSLPGDLHKLWETRDPLGYHVEYGYSCMGYEVAGALGIAMADPEREVICMVGDGSWLMMSSEIATAVQERVAFTVVLLDNHGFASIGGLSESLGSGGFGTRWRVADTDEPLPIDLAANAASLGAATRRCSTLDELRDGLAEARGVRDRPTVLVVEVDRESRVPGYDSWWDVPVAEVSEQADVQAAREQYQLARAGEQWWV